MDTHRALWTNLVEKDLVYKDLFLKAESISKRAFMKSA